MRLLDAVPEQGEISLANLLRTSGMRLDETIPVLAELLDHGWVIAVRERRNGGLTRLFRRAAPGERADQDRRVVYARTVDRLPCSGASRVGGNEE